MEESSATGDPSVAANQSAAQDSATTSRSFCHLPAEVQLQIWEEAALSLPTVDIAEFHFDITTDKSYARTRADPGFVACFNPSEEFIESIHDHLSLLRVCHLSRLVVLKLKPTMLPIKTIKTTKTSDRQTSKHIVQDSLIPFDTKSTRFCVTGVYDTFTELTEGTRRTMLPAGYTMEYVFARLGGLDFGPMIQDISFIFPFDSDHSPVLYWCKECQSLSTRFMGGVNKILHKLPNFNIKNIGFVLPEFLQERKRMGPELFWSSNYTREFNGIPTRNLQGDIWDLQTDLCLFLQYRHVLLYFYGTLSRWNRYKKFEGPRDMGSIRPFVCGDNHCAGKNKPRFSSQAQLMGHVGGVGSI